MIPNLDGVNTLAVDLETCDPNLMTKGCGAFRRDGFIAGIAVGAPDRQWYFPLAHPTANMPREHVLRFAKTLLEDPNRTIIGHNIIYDLQWLKAAGITPRCKLVDTMYAEALLDEAKVSYSLDATAQTHLGTGKCDDEVYQWLSEKYGGPATRKAQGGRLHLADVNIITPYACADVELPMRIWERQYARLREEDLLPVLRMECDLIPVLLGMRERGIRVDTDKAEQLATALRTDTIRLKSSLYKHVGREINVNSNLDLSKAFDALGIPYGRTEKGAPSFTRESLSHVTHPIAATVLAIRRNEKFVSTFLEGYILNAHHNGRVYGEFHPLRSDAGGTVSGRFSSSNPNLENLPSRDDELAPLVRGCFLPEKGEKWVSMDYSQIEYRILCHYGKGDSADAARSRYRQDPATDYHQLVADITGLPRKVAKTINFSKAYGAGPKKLAEQMGCSVEEANEFVTRYDSELPFVKELLERCSNIAHHRGYIKTLLGRRSRFDLWVPKKWAEGVKPLSREEALAKWGLGNIRKHKLHAALNRLIQGTAADMFKKALLDGYNAGMYNDDAFGMPLNLVHDEICFSAPDDNHIDRMRDIMIGAVPLSVPVLVDVETGPNWGDVK